MFLFQTPVSHSTSSIFIYTPEEELLERPALPQQCCWNTLLTTDTLCFCTAPLCSGAVPSVPGPFTVPVHISQQLHQRNKGQQGKENWLEDASSLLFFPFPPSPLWEAVGKKISYWLLCHPGVKQVSIFQNTNGENHPSCSCLQGQSALFVPWMLNTRFIKVMLLLRVYSSYLTNRPHNRFIYPGNKEKTVHIRPYNQCCLEQVSLSFIYLFQEISALFTLLLCCEG